MEILGEFPIFSNIERIDKNLKELGTMKEKDSMLFPITDIFDLAETLANLSDEGLNTLKTSLVNDYGINLELKKELCK